MIYMAKRRVIRVDDVDGVDGVVGRLLDRLRDKASDVIADAVCE